jgi:hypothetical protein
MLWPILDDIAIPLLVIATLILFSWEEDRPAHR